MSGLAPVSFHSPWGTGDTVQPITRAGSRPTPTSSRRRSPAETRMPNVPRARRGPVALLALLALATLLTVAAPAAAQRTERYTAPAGRVTVIGLRRWTVSMLGDSLHRRSPGTTLEDAACVAVLRDELHFADAFVEWRYFSDGPGRPEQKTLTIKLVEPADARRVQWGERWMATL
jgi:hypothetical protein